MSRCRWLQHTPLVVGVIILAALILTPLVDYKREADRAYQAAEQEYEESKRISPPGRAVADGKDTDHKAYRDEWRSEQDLKAQREMADTSWWMALAAWIGVFFLAATLWETAKAAKGAADAADATRKGVDLAADTAKWQLRAYVACTVVKFSAFSAGQKPVASITIKNSGSTPAHDIITKISMMFGDCPQTREMAEGEIAGIVDPVGIMGPGDSINANRERGAPMSEDQFNAVVAGKRALYIVTDITYVDVFGKRCRSVRWHMVVARCIAEKGNHAHVCPYGHRYEYDIGEEA
jgi:hypothetical protein